MLVFCPFICSFEMVQAWPSTHKQKITRWTVSYNVDGGITPLNNWRLVGSSQNEMEAKFIPGRQKHSPGDGKVAKIRRQRERWQQQRDDKDDNDDMMTTMATTTR